MKRTIIFTLCLLSFAALAQAQYAASASGSSTAAAEINAKMAYQVGAGAPSGNCVMGKVRYLNSSNGDEYACTATNTWTLKGATGSGTGDASTNTSTSVDSEIAVFSGTAGKTLKRATGTGLARVASGVLSAAELSGDVSTSGSNVVALDTKLRTVGIIAYEVGAEDGAAALTTTNFTNHAIKVNDAYAKTLVEASCISDAGDQTVTVKIGGTTLFSIHCVAPGTYSVSTTNGTTGYIIAASMGSTAVGAHAQLDLSGTANTSTKDVKLIAYGTVN